MRCYNFPVQNKPLIFILAAIVVIVAVFGAVRLSKRTSSSLISTSDQTTNQQTEEKKAEPTAKESSAPIVPLPQEEDIIRTFFNLIGEGRASDAVGMMTQTSIGDDSSKQAWGVQFNAFKSVSVKKIEPSSQEEWIATRHTYKVTVDAQMKPEAASAPIPNYGWENGESIRWIPLEKVDGLWKIAGIATGP